MLLMRLLHKKTKMCWLQINYMKNQKKYSSRSFQNLEKLFSLPPYRALTSDPFLMYDTCSLQKIRIQTILAAFIQHETPRGSNLYLLPFAQIAMSAENKEKVYSWAYCNHISKILTYIILRRSPFAPVSIHTCSLTEHTDKPRLLSNSLLHLNPIVHAHSTEVIY